MKPSTLFIARFIGYINLIKGKIESIQNHSFRISTRIGDIINANTDLKEMLAGDEVTVIIRPESAAVVKSFQNTQRNGFAGKILNYTYIGSIVRYNIDINGMEDPFIIDVSNPEGKGIFREGENVSVKLPERFHCIKKK